MDLQMYMTILEISTLVGALAIATYSCLQSEKSHKHLYKHQESIKGIEARLAMLEREDRRNARNADSDSVITIESDDEPLLKMVK